VVGVASGVRGCRKGDLLFVSAQSAIDPDGNVLFPGEHSAQARSSYEGILEIVGMAGGSVDDILDFTSFHQDLRGAEATFTDIYMPEVLKGELSDERAPSTSHVGTPGLEKPGTRAFGPSPISPRATGPRSHPS
jgi:enamine deaminase RidA (YjgF/YER057c/UK114 family)